MSQRSAERLHDETRPAPAEDRPAHREPAVRREAAIALPVAGRLLTKRPGTVDTTLRPRSVAPSHDTGTVVRRRVSVRGDHTPADMFGQRQLIQPEPVAFDADVENLLTVVDNTTTTALQQILNRPLFTGLEALVDLSGYLTLWVRKMKDAVARGFAAGLSSAQFGYAIETLACHLLGASQGGWQLSYQIASGSTRPDIVATKGQRQVWIDLTADSALSVAHIYTIKRWHQSNICPYPHAEVVYPPLTGAEMMVMMANAKLEQAGQAPAAQVDAQALQASVQAAAAKLQQDVARWRGSYAAPFRMEVKPSAVNQRGDSGTDPDGEARAEVFQWFNRNMGTHYTSHKNSNLGARGRGQRQRWAKGQKPKIDPFQRADPKLTAESAEAASVLMVLGIQPTQYGIVNGTPTQARGIAFLTKLDQQQDEAKVAAASQPVNANPANAAPVFVFGAAH